MFIEDFTELISVTLPVYHNNLYLGDFNLHVSDVQDTDSAIFNDSIDTMDMYQHVHFQTHKSGNILDLILSDNSDGTNAITTAPGPYLTDHSLVIANLNIKKFKPNQRSD